MAFTAKQRRFIEEYTVDFNATQAAIRAGYSEKTAYSIGQENLKKPEIAEAVADRLRDVVMTADEATKRMANAARFDASKYLIKEDGMVWFDLDQLKADGHGWYVKGLKYDSKGRPVYETWDSQRALEKIFDNVNPALGDKERPIEIKVTLSDD